MSLWEKLGFTHHTDASVCCSCNFPGNIFIPFFSPFSLSSKQLHFASKFLTFGSRLAAPSFKRVQVMREYTDRVNALDKKTYGAPDVL